jgi:hypothetical protein
MFTSQSLVYSNELGTCQPYTTDDYAAIWGQVRYNQCAYYPIPPKDDDP